jgi:phospholipid-binding lipoprotein MlaA
MTCGWQRALPCVLILVAAQPARAADDPLEDWNRRVHALNLGLQRHVLKPMAAFYVSVTSAEVRQGTANVFANLAEPLTALSSLAVGDLGQAANAAARFGINSTLGIAGARDRAAALGYPPRPFAVADAVCAWGVPSGPFVMLPLLGPSTLRDAAALLASSTALSQALGTEAVLAWNGGELFTGYVGIRHEIDRVEAEALDAYAVHRSAYLQRRAGRCPADRAELLAEAEAAPDDDPPRR